MCQDELGPENLPRGLHYKEKLDDYETFGSIQRRPEQVAWINEPEKLVQAALAGKSANLIGSLIAEKCRRPFGRLYHAPTLDFDFPCRLVPSSTPGHFHFYIDKAITEERYFELLETLHRVGLLQLGVLKSAKAHGQTYLRWNTTKQSEGLM